jgi:hypothetical protein
VPGHRIARHQHQPDVRQERADGLDAIARQRTVACALLAEDVGPQFLFRRDAFLVIEQAEIPVGRPLLEPRREVFDLLGDDDDVRVLP